LDVARLARHEEPALGGRQRREAAAAVAAQKQPIARAHASDGRLHAVKVTRQQEIELAIAIEVAR
jgi:hypothetical protein